tara:strand:+ start:714 stop:1313 length:600 start_codon:yes stop_codon:yes gene_type:complete
MATAKIKVRNAQKPNDIVYTPLSVAKLMIDLCDIKPNDKVLDPSRGANGIFFNNLPECNKDYCEITEDKDFFTYDKPVDIIIGNPPYSLWTKWLKHTITLNPKKFCYIFGVYNFTPPRLQKIFDAGYKLTTLHIIKVNWWFSTSFICVFDKCDKDSVISITPKSVLCECGNNHHICRRGRTYKGKKIGANECFIIKKLP